MRLTRRDKLIAANLLVKKEDSDLEVYQVYRSAPRRNPDGSPCSDFWACKRCGAAASHEFRVRRKGTQRKDMHSRRFCSDCLQQELLSVPLRASLRVAARKERGAVSVKQDDDKG